MSKHKAIAIGLLAGTAGGLMALAAFQAGAAALVMLFAAPAAVYIASLGWGTIAGFVGAIVAAGVSSIHAGPSGAVMTGCLLFLPAAWGGHLANLGQPAPDGQGMIWYPLGSILMRLTAAVAAGFVVVGVVSGYDSQQLQESIILLMREIISASPDAPPVDEARLAANARLYAAFIPLIVPATWLALHVAIFHLSAAIARRSGRMPRPRDDIAASLSLPIAATAWPAAGIAGMLTGTSPVYDIGAVMAGTGILAFSMNGLAEMHLASRGKAGRGLLLFGSYLLIALFTVPILIFAATGIARSWRARTTPPAAGS